MNGIPKFLIRFAEKFSEGNPEKVGDPSTLSPVRAGSVGGQTLALAYPTWAVSPFRQRALARRKGRSGEMRGRDLVLSSIEPCVHPIKRLKFLVLTF